jgi:Fur family transcriptional regulator, iron response regulator
MADMYCFNNLHIGLLKFSDNSAYDMTETDITATPDVPETVIGPDADSCRAAEPCQRDHETLLRDVGLRPTRQRVALAQLLFAQGDHHFTAEMLYSEATQSNLQVSLATVYNTLNQFAKVGLLREIGVDGSTTYFDTKVSDHHHFFIEGMSEIRDIPSTQIRIGKMASIPEGYEISRVDLVIRLRPRR